MADTTPAVILDRVTVIYGTNRALRDVSAVFPRGAVGLRRRHQTVQVADTPQNRGMIYAAKHLLTVQE